MANICKTVNLYTRKIKGGKMLSYFLDYYPGYRDEATNKVMRHESLGIYIYAHPKTQREKDYNARRTEKAEALRCRRYEEIVNERYEFFDRNKLNGSFIDYFKTYASKKNSRYEQAFLHFDRFVGSKCTFGEVTVELCNKFLEYLRSTPQVIHQKRKLHTNTIASYWSAFLGTLHTAHRDRKIKENPCPYLERVQTIPSDKVGLSAEELVRVAETPCEIPVLKTAFLFSCLTGLRFLVGNDTAGSGRNALHHHPYAEDQADNPQPHWRGSPATDRRQQGRSGVSGLQGQHDTGSVQEMDKGGRHYQKADLSRGEAHLLLAATRCRDGLQNRAGTCRAQEPRHHATLSGQCEHQEEGSGQPDYLETCRRMKNTVFHRLIV